MDSDLSGMLPVESEVKLQQVPIEPEKPTAPQPSRLKDKILAKIRKSTNPEEALKEVASVQNSEKESENEDATEQSDTEDEAISSSESDLDTNDTDPELQPAKNPNDPEDKSERNKYHDVVDSAKIQANEEYAKLVVEFHKGNITGDQYELLKQKIIQKRKKEDKSGAPRVFTEADRQRHQKLLELASKKKLGIKGGVKDPQAFLRMVEYIETNDWHSKIERESLDHEPTSEELDAFKSKWQEKGYELQYSFPDPNSPTGYELTFWKKVPSDLSEETVEVLRDISNSAKNSAAALESLNQIGLYNVREISQGGNYVSADTKAMIQFLKSPGAENILRTAGKITKFKKFHSDYGKAQQHYDELRKFAKSDFAAIPIEDLDRIDIISSAGGMDVNFTNLNEWRTLLQNPRRLEFMASMYNSEQGRLPYDVTEAQQVMGVLESDGILQPLTELFKSNVTLGVNATSHVIDRESRDYQNLKAFVGSEDVKEFLGNSDMKDYAGVIRAVTGRPASISELKATWGNKEKVSTFLSKIVSDEERNVWKKEAWKQRDLLVRTNAFIDTGNFDTFITPQFQEYIRMLNDQHGISFDINDYTQVFRSSRYGYRDNQGYLPMELFQLKEIIDIYGKKDVADIVMKSRSDEDKDITEAWNAVEWYKNRAKTLPTIRALNTYKEIIGSEKVGQILGKESWELRQIQDGGLCTEEILGQIPPEQLPQWIDGIMNVPPWAQFFLSQRITEQGRVSPIEIQKLAELSLYVNEGKAYYLPQRNVVSVLVHSEKGLSELFPGGVPSDTLLSEVLSMRDGELLTAFAKNQTHFNISENNLVILENWARFNPQVQAMILEEPGDLSALLGNFPEKYQVLLDLYDFGIQRLNPQSLTKVKDLGDKIGHLVNDGVPTKDFVDLLVKSQDFEVISQVLVPEVLAQYEGVEQTALKLLTILPENLRTDMLRDEPTFPAISEQSAEKYAIAAEVIEAIKESPSAEIKRLQSELIEQLWRLDDPRGALAQIQGIFEKNNLPLVGKIYRVFETIYDNPSGGTSMLDSKLDALSNLSPQLKEASKEERRKIIYKDLLRVHVDSANPSLESYLQVLKTGESLVAKFESSGSEEQSLSEAERLQLGYFLDKMDMMYVTSLFGRTIEARRKSKNPSQYTDPNTSGMPIAERISRLRKNFRVKPDQNLTSRLNEMFVAPLGLNGIEEVLERSHRARAEADARNQDYAQEGMEKDGKLIIKPGDRLKGTGAQYLRNILENGSVAKEYLGSSSGSDLTPFDTDTSLILEEDIENGIESALSNSISKGYGEVVLLVRDRGQFDPGDPNSYESFESGTAGTRHVGIRTGFASTEIDGMILNGLEANPKAVDDLYTLIAERDFYIPVADSSGTILFSPEKYREYRKAFDGVERFGGAKMEVTRVSDQKDLPIPPEIAGKVISDIHDLIPSVRANELAIASSTQKIRGAISQVLGQEGVTLRNEFDTSILGAELIDTGSTSRNTAVPGSFDFDLMLLLDGRDIRRARDIARGIDQVLGGADNNSHSEVEYIQVRKKDVESIAETPVEIDVGVGKRSDYGTFGTHDALKEKLNGIREQMGEDTYYEVLANIVLAKKILKESHAYKKLEEGGMGGVGVENWILANNGNIVDAFRNFYTNAHRDGAVVPLEEFKKRNKLIDAGLNVKYGNHDEFFGKLTEQGYAAMITSVRNYLQLA